MSDKMDPGLKVIFAIALVGMGMIMLVIILKAIETEQDIRAGLVQKIVIVPETRATYQHTETIWTKPDQPTTVEATK